MPAIRLGESICPKLSADFAILPPFFALAAFFAIGKKEP